MCIAKWILHLVHDRVDCMFFVLPDDGNLSDKSQEELW